jgi:ribosomal protein S18 acetylase RimI-like enzyme
MTSRQSLPAFDLPAALLSQGYALRPETEGDIPFLMRLYASTRADELAPIPWTPERKAAFLAQQFAAQRHDYYTRIENCRFAVLEHKGEPVGRLYLQDRPTRLHVVDIALMPAWRGRGVGTAILEALQAAGRASGRGVGIFVEKFNPALGLYRRLGFVDIRDVEVYLEMEWMPEPRRAVS